jgi:N utilization substance protein A
MSKITYDAQLLKLMPLFERVTRTRVKDVFYDDNELLTFVVPQKDIGKAIGKNASNVKKLKGMLKRNIKIVAFNSSPTKFVENLIYPIKAQVEKQGNTIVIKGNDTKSKGILIGRNKSNIINTQNIVNKYFKDIEEIKVV